MVGTSNQSVPEMASDLGIGKLSVCEGMEHLLRRFTY